MTNKKRDFAQLAKKVKDAKRRLAGVTIQTPLIHSKSLSELMCCQVHLKLENLQITGSYKLRGAFNAIASLPSGKLAKGVITASAGNHAQGVAYAARHCKIEKQTTICMPADTPQVKIDNTAAYGVNVVTENGKGEGLEDYDAAKKYARSLETQTGKTYISAFDNEMVVAGQGTIGLEILHELPDTDAIIAPVGGGGLISGISLACTALQKKQKTQLIAVEAEGAAHALRSLKAAKLATALEEVKTIADGIKVKEIGELNFDVMHKFVDYAVAVKERHIYQAMALLFEKAKVVAEGAGAVALASLLPSCEHRKAKKLHKATFSKEIFKNDFYSKSDEPLTLPESSKIVVVVSGGNIDASLFNKVIDYEMHLSKNYLRVMIRLEDKPGQLSSLLSELASSTDPTITANVADIIPFGSRWGAPAGFVDMEILIETKGEKHKKHLAEHLQSLEDVSGFKVEIKG